MPIGKVENVSPTKSGKALRVKVVGNYYNAFLDSGIDKVVGQTIDFQVTPDKGYGPGIGQWGPAVNQPQASAPQAPNSPVAASGDRFYMPFVSNVVAHAIAAGRVQNPADLNAWAKAAYDAAQALDTL